LASVPRKVTGLAHYLNRVYDALVRDEPAQPADMIFVLAGRMERKRFGLELYQAGLAPRLLISIGRYEISRLRPTGLENVDELIALRDRTPPGERHFFWEKDATGVRIHQAPLRRWSTYGEVLALRAYLEPAMPRSLIVVSTDVHLRRVALVFERIFRGVPLETRFCAVPTPLSAVQKAAWWTRAKDRRSVLTELLKLAGYKLILAMPDRLIPLLMRLQR
jgi:uncharacterized SAM-binding protein YcdF (DUF218 family)